MPEGLLGRIVTFRDGPRLLAGIVVEEPLPTCVVVLVACYHDWAGTRPSLPMAGHYRVPRTDVEVNGPKVNVGGHLVLDRFEPAIEPVETLKISES